MALEVLSTSPLQLDENFYIDSPIEITFSQEIHASSLTTDNVRLYLMPGWTGQIELASITAEGAKIIIVPANNLPKETNFALWLRGDDDTEDNDIKGIASTLGQSLDGHFQLDFKTGVKIQADDAPIETIDVTAEVLETVEDQNAAEELLQSNENLDVLGTYPANGAMNVSGLTDIVVKMDQELGTIDLSDPIINAASGVINIQAENFIYGAETIIPDIEANDFEIVDDSLRIALTEELSINTLYTITIQRDRIAGSSGQKLPADYIFEFGTKLVPMYASTDAVRRKGGKLIPRNLPNSALMRYIHDASIWVYDMLEGAPLEPPYNYKMVQATIFKTICDIATSCSLNDLRYIKDKQLADLRIVYDNVAVQRVIDDYCSGATSLLAQLSPNVGVRSGVKSKVNHRYPGSKRHIHKYGKYAASQRFNTDGRTY